MSSSLKPTQDWTSAAVSGRPRLVRPRASSACCGLVLSHRAIFLAACGRRSPGPSRGGRRCRAGRPTRGPARRGPRARGACAPRRSPAPRRGGCGHGARSASPPPRCGRGARRSSSTSSGTPAPLAASVRTTGTRHERCGPSASTALTSRTIVSARGWSALLTTITSGISITPALSAWIESPEPGISARTIVSAWSTTSISPWPDADRLEQHVVLAGRVHQQRRLERRLGEAAERAARRHRADEDARVEEVVREADPVAQHGAPRERARRVDRQHADLAIGLAKLDAHRADQRALPHPGRPGDADHAGAAGAAGTARPRAGRPPGRGSRRG